MLTLAEEQGASLGVAKSELRREFDRLAAIVQSLVREPSIAIDPTLVIPGVRRGRP